MKSKEFISHIFSAVMVMIMLLIVAILVRWEFFAPDHPRQALTQRVHTRQIKNWHELELTGYRIGPAKAPVQIVEFFDYECPFCKASEPAIKAIRKKYSEKVTVVYEDFPLTSIHPYAFKASIAAECARKQDMFMAYHDSLFASQRRLGRFSYTRLAARVGVADTAAFHRCVQNVETKGIIQSGKTLGDSLGINGTPAFLINDKLVVGELSTTGLNRLVKAAFAEVNE